MPSSSNQIFSLVEVREATVHFDSGPSKLMLYIRNAIRQAKIKEIL